MNTLLNEKLLDAWLRVSTSINNSRMVSELSYNESLICNILFRHNATAPECTLTATDLCIETKMLKSQMNRTLNQMEKKQLISKERSLSDKRKVFIRLNPACIKTYTEQHEQILAFLDSMIAKLGENDVQTIIHSLHRLSDVADELIQHSQKEH